MRYTTILTALIAGMITYSYPLLADSDFDKYENTITMTCYSDDGESTQWSYKGSLLYMDGVPLEIDGETVKKKSGKNIFLVKVIPVEILADFEKRRQVSSIFGLEYATSYF